MSNEYQRETKFINLGTVYIRDGGAKKFASIRLGNQNLMAQLEDVNAKYPRFVEAGKMTQAEADAEIAKNNEKGAKYDIKIVVEQ